MPKEDVKAPTMQVRTPGGKIPHRQRYYEYGPFGEPVRVSEPDGLDNPFRFSTKYTDDESGLLYYGYRYYNPTTGRWLNRDPIGEVGGFNIYAVLPNDMVGSYDVLGLVNVKYWTLNEIWNRVQQANSHADILREEVPRILALLRSRVRPPKCVSRGGLLISTIHPFRIAGSISLNLSSDYYTFDIKYLTIGAQVNLNYQTVVTIQLDWLCCCYDTDEYADLGVIHVKVDDITYSGTAVSYSKFHLDPTAGEVRMPAQDIGSKTWTVGFHDRIPVKMCPDYGQ